MYYKSLLIIPKPLLHRSFLKNYSITDHVIKSIANHHRYSTWHPPPMESHTNLSDLIAAFRSYYYQFVKSVEEAAILPTDSTVLNRLGDRIDEYQAVLIQV